MSLQRAATITKSRPVPGTKAFERQLLKGLEHLAPVEHSLKGRLRHTAARAFECVRRLAKSNRVFRLPDAPPPSRAASIVAPPIFVTAPDAPVAGFRPIQRQARVKAMKDKATKDMLTVAVVGRGARAESSTPSGLLAVQESILADAFPEFTDVDAVGPSPDVADTMDIDVAFETEASPEILAFNEQAYAAFYAEFPGSIPNMESLLAEVLDEMESPTAFTAYPAFRNDSADSVLSSEAHFDVAPIAAPADFEVPVPAEDAAAIIQCLFDLWLHTDDVEQAAQIAGLLEKWGCFTAA